MAIRDLRQQNIFDQYGLNLNMPSMYSDFGSSNYEEPDYSNDYQQGPRSIYDAYEGPDYGPVNQPDYTPPPPPESIFEQLRGQYHPETEATEKFNQLIAGQPERGKSGWARKLVAAMAGIGGGGIGTASKIMDEPYERSMAQWKSQIDPAFQAANLERQSNMNERQLVGNMVTAKRVEDINRTNQDKIAATERTNQQKNEIAMIRARAYDFLSRAGKGYQIDVSGPTVRIFNRDTGDMKDTGMETGKLDEQTKIELQNYGRIEAARETGANAMNRATMNAPIYKDDQGLYRLDENGNRVPVQGGNNTTKVGGAKAEEKPNALESERQRQERMREIFETYSDDSTVQKYLKSNNGKYVLLSRPVVKEGTSFGPFSTKGVTQEEANAWDKLKAIIDPDYTPREQQWKPAGPIFNTPPPKGLFGGKQAPGVPSQAAPQVMPPVVPGRVRVRRGNQVGYVTGNPTDADLAKLGVTRVDPVSGKPPVRSYQD